MPLGIMVLPRGRVWVEYVHVIGYSFEHEVAFGIRNIVVLYHRIFLKLRGGSVVIAW
jgi:hypothetical protein